MCTPARSYPTVYYTYVCSSIQRVMRCVHLCISEGSVSHTNVCKKKRAVTRREQRTPIPLYYANSTSADDDDTLTSLNVQTSLPH